jgi:AraC-like DNA-binding protein/CheY-like chemotaxis protein
MSGASHESAILVVDDEPAALTFLCRLLSRNGYHASAASSGREALTQLGDTDFDLVLADLELGPGPSGLDLLRLMPSRNRGKKFFLLTGWGTQARCRDAFLAGAADFLAKPIRPASLLLALAGGSSPSSSEPERPGDSNQVAPLVSRGVIHVRDALQLMASQFANPDLTVDSIAQSLHVSIEHLCRSFAHHTGRSPLEHLHDVRLSEAWRLLTATHLPVLEVALRCGYRCTSAFDRRFVRKFSRTPSVVRHSGSNPAPSHQEQASIVNIRHHR